MNPVDRFFAHYERRKAELDPDYERIPDTLIDLEIIRDRVWTKNPGDTFWRAMIEAFEHCGRSAEVAQLESRLSSARCFEAFHGYVFVFLSQAGVLGAKAGGAYSDDVAYLGASECAALGSALRELADCCVPPTIATPGRWELLAGTKYVELRASSPWTEFESSYARDLARELEEIGAGVTAESPPLEYGRRAPLVSMDEVARLVGEGSKLRAIAMYRALTGAGLAEAKTHVEGMSED